MTLDINPEFGIELVVALPYAYWLHQMGQLDKVITSKGMKPFYYFCDNVEERYTSRDINNEAAGLNQLPNNWIYGFKGNAELYKDIWPDWSKFSDVERGCGILDYSKWQMPDYNEVFKNSDISFNKPIIVISNRFNYEHGHAPLGYFDIECLYNLFTYLTDSGYLVVYKRPNNTEFPADQNEDITRTIGCTLQANVMDIGIINDYELTKYFDDVILLDDIVSEYPNFTYNEVQLKLFANTSGFITMGGGSTLFPCIFKKPTVAYYGRAMSESNRDRFFYAADGTKNIMNYHFMINPNLVIFNDVDGNDMLNNKYNNFIKIIKDTFK